ncbi:MAG: ABC transporter permease [Dehalococcoidia bacterium]|nr:ABC transporter permease [Dehalococcoidia bacterium]
MIAQSSRLSWETRRWWSRLPLTFLVVFVTVTLVAPFMVPLDPDAVDLSRRLAPPGPDAWLGRDSLGRDVLPRLVHGGQRALVTGVLAVTLSMVLATGVGLASGYLGGPIDLAVSAVLDALLALPGLLITLAILGVLGAGPVSLILALVGASWAAEARVIRGTVMAVRESGYVEAARALGASPARLMTAHILPNMATPIVVLASLNLGEALLVVAALSFLGLGAQPPAADWGVMLADSRPFAAQAPWLMLAPGVCIVVFSLLANLAGDSARNALDPRDSS